MEKLTKTTQRSFRFSKKTNDQLEALYESINKQNELYGLNKIGYTDIVERAISNLFLKEIDGVIDSDVSEKLGDTMDNKLKIALKGYEDFLKNILYENIKTNEYLNIIFESNLIEEPDEKEKEEIVKNRNNWEEIIEKHLARIIKNRK